MDLQSRQAVNDFDAGLLHQFRREVIVFLVETRFEFDEDRYFLAVFGRADQAVDDRRIFRDAILRDFYFQYFRVKSRLHQEAQQIVERLIREVQQHILFSQHPQYRRVGFQFRYAKWRRKCLLKAVAYGIGQLRQIGKIEISSRRQQFFLFDFVCLT